MTEQQKEIKEIVIARLEAMSSNKRISIGSFGEFTKEELIKRVKENDPIGKKIIEIELEFLRAIRSIYGGISSI